MQEPTDSDVIQAFLAGDESSLRLLFQRHFKAIYRYIVGLIGPADADDAVQEAFIRAWRHLPSFDQKRSFKAWLYRIAHNAALDLLKKRRPAAFSEVDRPDEGLFFEDTLIDAQDPIPELLDRRDAAERLSRALEELPITQRSVLRLHYLDELTFSEIAEMLDEPIDTVKSRSRRALISLKKLMES